MITAKLRGEDLNKRATLAFGVVGAGVLLASMLRDSVPWLMWMFKPLIIPVLAWWWITARRGDQRLGQRYFMVAMAGSWWGDVALMFPGDGAFIMGLIGFLIGHLGFIGAFSRPGPPPGARRVPWGAIAALVACGLLLLLVLWNNLGALRLPVMVYAGVLVTMASVAVGLRGRVRTGAYPWLAMGAVLFVVSDSLIALNKFGGAFFGAGFFVLLTYLIAQYTLVRGWIMHTQPS